MFLVIALSIYFFNSLSILYIHILHEMSQITPVLQMSYSQKLTTMIDPVRFHNLHCFVSTISNKLGAQSNESMHDHYV